MDCAFTRTRSTASLPGEHSYCHYDGRVGLHQWPPPLTDHLTTNDDNTAGACGSLEIRMEDIAKFFIDFASMEKVPNESDFSQVMMSRWRNSSCTHYFALNFSLGNTYINQPAVQPAYSLYIYDTRYVNAFVYIFRLMLAFGRYCGVNSPAARHTIQQWRVALANKKNAFCCGRERSACLRRIIR